MEAPTRDPDLPLIGLFSLLTPQRKEDDDLHFLVQRPLSQDERRKSKVKGSRNGIRKEKSIAEMMTSTGVQDQDGRA